MLAGTHCETGKYLYVMMALTDIRDCVLVGTRVLTANQVDIHMSLVEDNRKVILNGFHASSLCSLAKLFFCYRNIVVDAHLTYCKRVCTTEGRIACI